MKTEKRSHKIAITYILSEGWSSYYTRNWYILFEKEPTMGTNFLRCNDCVRSAAVEYIAADADADADAVLEIHVW